MDYAWKKHRFVVLTAMLVFAGSFSAVSAISKGYFSDSDLAVGTVVSLSSGAENEVAPAQINQDNIVGVVVAKESGTVSVSDDDAQVQVATDGVENIHVSTIYGDIKAGDPIGVSPIEGIGAKAISSGKIIGVAQKDFDEDTITSTVSVQKTDSSTENAKIGSLPVVIQVSFYTLNSSEDDRSISLQSIGSDLAGKPVSTVKLAIAVILFISGVIAATVILYSGVRSSLTAVGRNPMAKKSIYGGLKKVILVGLGILAAALLAAYIVLKV